MGSNYDKRHMAMFLEEIGADPSMFWNYEPAWLSEKMALNPLAPRPIHAAKTIRGRPGRVAMDSAGQAFWSYGLGGASMNLAKDYVIIARPGAPLAVLVLAGCSLLSGGPTASDGPPSYGLRATALEEYWSRAISIAEEWRADAYVKDVSIDVALPNSPASLNHVAFTFQSPSADMVSLSVSCEDGDCQSLQVMQEAGYPVAHCAAIEASDAEISSQDALEAGLQNGGSQFVYGSHTLLSLTLSHQAGNEICSDRLTWRVSFFEPVTRGIRVFIDARTGEILE